MINLKVIKLVCVLCFGLLIGCSVDRNTISKNKRKEINEWCIVGDTILCNNKPVAVYDHIEYEMYLGKTTIEISITQIDGNLDNTESLVNFVHNNHKKDKVEIVIKK